MTTLADTANSLEKAFLVFQQQSEKLEQTHRELQAKLDTAQTDLEQKNRELATRIQEVETMKENLSVIVESISDAVIQISSSKGLMVANSAAWSLIDDCEKDGLSLFERPELVHFIGTDKNATNTELTLTLFSEERHYFLSVIHLDRGDLLEKEQVISLKEVTDQKRLQKQAERNDRLRALGHVAASVAHEIRNPLAAIEGFTTLLKRDLESLPDAQRLADKSLFATRQLNSVVTNLLGYTRELQSHKNICDLNDIIQNSLDIVMPIAESHKVILSVTLTDEPLSGTFDTNQITQVIINLITNAIDACPFDGSGLITVKTFRTKKSFGFIVSDNGPGIPKQQKKKVFEPFFTLKEGGVGLGLALCGRIADLHKAHLIENGKHGTGADFTLTFPIEEINI